MLDTNKLNALVNNHALVASVMNHIRRGESRACIAQSLVATVPRRYRGLNIATAPAAVDVCFDIVWDND